MEYLIDIHSPHPVVERLLELGVDHHVREEGEGHLPVVRRLLAEGVDEQAVSEMLQHPPVESLLRDYVRGRQKKSARSAES